MPTQSGLTPTQLTERFGGQLVRDGSRPVDGFRPWESAGLDHAVFLVPKRLAQQFEFVARLKAGLAVLPDGVCSNQLAVVEALSVILHPDPYLFFAKASNHFLKVRRHAEVPETQIHVTAVVHPSAQIGQRVRIGPLAVIGAGAVIGDGCDIGAQVHIGEGADLGRDCVLHPRAALGPSVRLGDRVILQMGCIVGSDGFGYAPTADKEWVKIPQVGSVLIGNDVELGANTVVDRGALGDTIIEDGVKVDNLVQIAHNVYIGAHTAIAGCVGIAGSARIGRYCQIGGAAGILGHLSIADGCIIGPMSLVTTSLETSQKYVGIMPLQAEQDWRRTAAALRHLPELRRQIRAKAS